MARSQPRPNNQIRAIALLLIFTLILSACGGAEETVSTAPTAPTVAVDAPAPTAVPIEAPAPTQVPETEAAPTSAPAAEASPAEPTDWTETVTVEGDYYVRGNPAAPIRLIDYSDFL